MTESRPRPRPLAAAGFVTGAVAVAAWALALVRPWGDVGVTDGVLVTARPVGLVVVLGAGALAALALAVAGSPLPRRWAVGAAAVVTALGAVLVALTVGTAGAQVLPRDGSAWGLLTAVAVTVTGVTLAAAAVLRPAGRSGARVTLAVAVVVPVALVVAGVVVVPGWDTHRVDAAYPASFSESPGPTTVDRLAWQQPVGDDLAALIGGRVVVARDTTGAAGCALQVQALDAGTRERIWSVRRPLRCDGPRLAVLDGNNSTVRVTLRAEVGGAPLTGPPLTLYLGLEDGRSFAPSAALDRVQAWTEGFGLVLGSDTLAGLDSRTGVTIWSRRLPACGAGSVTVGVPAAVPAGQRAARTPYDGGRPNGTVPVTSVAGDLVVGTTCDTGGTVTRSAWFVDVVNGPERDRTVVLPTTTPGDPAGSTAAAADEPTTFLTWLDTVVAAVPVTGPGTTGTGTTGTGTTSTALVGLDRTAGAVLWTRPAAVVDTVDVSPADGFVSVSGSSAATGDPRAGRTFVLGARTGQVLASRDDPSPVLASVALVGGRVEFAADATFVVRDPVSGRAGDTVPTDGCAPGVDTGTAPALAGPGGVVLRCSGGDRLVGVADRR